MIALRSSLSASRQVSRTRFASFKTSLCVARAASSSTPKKTAIITGSSRGIGKAIAVRLAQDGYAVCLNDVPANASLLEATASEIAAAGGTVHSHVADVTKRSQVKDLISVSVENLGPLTTMIANAGIAQIKPVLELTESDVQSMFDVNVFGVFNCFALAAQQLISQGTKGKLIAAASVAAFKPFPMLAHYASSKWAVRGLAHAFSSELAPHGITANCYAPGIVATPMWEKIDAELGRRRAEKTGSAIQAGAMMRKYSEEMISLGRTSEPEDVSKTVSWMASEDADYVTGQTIVVDGGIVYT